MLTGECGKVLTCRATSTQVFGFAPCHWLRLRGVQVTGESEGSQRHTLELLLREEEEYLKLQMYVRDNRFCDLLHESGHRTELRKTILDMLHCPMRTNEKVLNLLYEEVTQGAHKAEMKDTLDELTTSIRRVGEFPPSFTHKFEKKTLKFWKKSNFHTTNLGNCLQFTSYAACENWCILRYLHLIQRGVKSG